MMVVDMGNIEFQRLERWCIVIATTSAEQHANRDEETGALRGTGDDVEFHSGELNELKTAADGNTAI